MSDKPIIFSTEMVKAILNGEKTQTRRIIKGQYLDGAPSSFAAYELEDGKYGFSNDDSEWVCPYGKPQDKLYVRETTLFWRNTSDNSISHVAAYKADGYGLKNGERWTPSIHVPKKYARILLEIESIKIERLQKISEGDAEKEGINFLREIPDADETLSAKILFEILWDSINKKRGFGWDLNPWVWVVKFKISEKTG